MVRRLFSISEILSVVVIVLAISIFGAHLFGALEVDGADCDMDGVWTVGVRSGGAWNGAVDIKWWQDAPSDTMYYTISTPAELAGLAVIVNSGDGGGGSSFDKKIITLLNDIDLNNEPWTPIGEYYYDNDNHRYIIKPFSGTFDGGGHSIKNLYIYSPSANCVGLFSYNGGTLENINVSGSVTGLSNVGGVVGYNEYGTVNDCSNTGSVSGNYHVGGVVGQNCGTVNNCSNTGSVSGDLYYVGGVAGDNGGDGMIENCSNTGSVTGMGYFVGGVSGYNTGSIINCSNIGNVSGDDYVGGVVGNSFHLNTTVDNCEWFNSGGNAIYGIGSGSNIGVAIVTNIYNLSIVGVIVRPAQIKIQPSEIKQLTAFVHPASADGSKKSVSWDSSNTGIATVSPSTGNIVTVTGVAVGTVTIKVTTSDDVLGGGKWSADATVIVYSPTPNPPKPDPDPPVPPVPPTPPEPPVPPAPPVPPVPDPDPPVPPVPPSPAPFVPVEPTEEVKEKINEANEELKEVGVEIEFGANPEEIEITALEEINAEIITTLANMEITVEEATEGEAMAACYDSLGKSSANFSVSLGGATQSSVKADEKVQLLPVFYTVTFTKDELTRNVPKGRTLDVNRLLSKPDPDDDALTELFDCYVIQKQITEGKRKGNLARLIGGGKLQLITATEARRKKVLRVSVVEGVSIKIGFQYFVADGEQDPKYHARANMFVIGDGLKNGKITDPLWINARKAGVEPPDGGSGCNAGWSTIVLLVTAVLSLPLRGRWRA